jgi:tetratricopeptide (TPR) repeat protein
VTYLKRSIVGGLIAITAVTGCGRKPTAVRAVNAPETRPGLNDLPLLQLAAPATQPAGPAPLEALQAYAEGRDALLRGDKATAIVKFTAAIEADNGSAIVWQDLGYALVGREDNRALSAFRQASAFDPGLIDARVQTARLLVNRGEKDAAIEQLRLARLSPRYDDNHVDAAVVDFLLGRLLEEKGLAAAAQDCYARVLPVVEGRSIELRNKPELSEIILRPNVLRLRMADLSAKAGEPEQAVKLYRELIDDEPSAAPVLRLRIASVLADEGKLAEGATEALAVVDQFDASRASTQAYIDLFATHGGDAAALKYLQSSGLKPGSDMMARAVVAARLERRLGRPGDAVKRLNLPPTMRYTGELVRETVAAYRDTGDTNGLVIRLLRMMTDQPAAWPQVARGWRILAQHAQPAPLRDQALVATDVPDPLKAAKAFVAGEIAREAGKPFVANRQKALAVGANAALFRRWSASPAVEASGPPDVDISSDRDVALFLEEFANEPTALNAGIALILQQGSKQRLLDALQAALQRPQPPVALLGPLVTLLTADDQKAEALRVAEATAAKVRSAGELYYIASLFTQLGEAAASERALRVAYSADPNNAAVCNDLGYTLIEAGRDTPLAETLLWKAAGLEPDHPAYVDSVGWMLYKRGDFEQALSYLDRAVNASDPPDPVVLDHAGDAAYRAGKLDQAKARWKAAVEAIRQGATSDPQMRLRIDHKLQQAEQKQPVGVAPAAR